MNAKSNLEELESATLRKLLTHLDKSHLPLLTHLDDSRLPVEEFGCFAAVSEDKTTIFVCPMNADGSPYRDPIYPHHMNWIEVIAPKPEFVSKINKLFGTSFECKHFPAT